MISPTQYIMVRTDNGLQVQWGDDTVLFDTKEEAEEMIKAFPSFFRDVSLRIEKGIYYINKSVKYKDLKEREDYKNELEAQNG